MSSYRLKGCPIDIINKLCHHIQKYSFVYGEDEYKGIINYEVLSLSRRIITTFSIKDCLSIILSQGDLFDAIKRSEGVELNMNDKLIYHRQLALPYIENIVESKINTKLNIMKMHKSQQKKKK